MKHCPVSPTSPVSPLLAEHEQWLERFLSKWDANGYLRLSAPQQATAMGLLFPEVDGTAVGSWFAEHGIPCDVPNLDEPAIIPGKDIDPANTWSTMSVFPHDSDVVGRSAEDRRTIMLGNIHERFLTSMTAVITRVPPQKSHEGRLIPKARWDAWLSQCRDLGFSIDNDHFECQLYRLHVGIEESPHQGVLWIDREGWKGSSLELHGEHTDEIDAAIKRFKLISATYRTLVRPVIREGLVRNDPYVTDFFASTSAFAALSLPKAKAFPW